MPNWCECRLGIYGNSKELNRFMEQSKVHDPDNEYDTDLSLNATIPIPDHLLEQGSGDEIGQWKKISWGIGRDVEAVRTVYTGIMAQYEFYSPWQPPIVWMVDVSKMYPNLRFMMKYDEPSEQFMGVAAVINGELENKVLSY